MEDPWSLSTTEFCALLYRSLIREANEEQRERIDAELTDPGWRQAKLEAHPAVQANPELGIRLRYQELIRAAKTETRRQELTVQLRDELVAERRRAERAEQADRVAAAVAEGAPA